MSIIRFHSDAPLSEQLDARFTNEDCAPDGQAAAPNDNIVSSSVNVQHLETIWNILVARVTAQSKKSRKNNAADAAPAEVLISFPDPATVHIPLTLGEAVDTCLDLLKLVVGAPGKMEICCSSKSASASALFSITSWICEVTAVTIRRNLKLESSVRLLAAARVKSKLEKISDSATAADVSGKQGAAAAAAAASSSLPFTAEEDAAMLEEDLLLVLTDAKLMDRRREALEALEEFEETLQPIAETDNGSSSSSSNGNEIALLSGSSSSSSCDDLDDDDNEGGDDDDDDDAAASSNLEKQQKKKKKEKAAAAKLREEAERQRELELTRAEIDWKLRAGLLVRNLSKTQDWRRSVVAFPTITSAAASDASSPTQSSCAASPRTRELLQQKKEQDDEEDDEDVSSWATGLSVLGPLITGENKSTNSCCSSSSLKALLVHRCALVERRSMRAFVHYWLTGLRRHVVHSAFATVCGCLSTAVSNPVVAAQQQLEKQLEPAMVYRAAKKAREANKALGSHLRSHGPQKSRYAGSQFIGQAEKGAASTATDDKLAKKTSNNNNSNNTATGEDVGSVSSAVVAQKCSSNSGGESSEVSNDFAPWAMTSVHLAANLISLKVLLSVLNTVMGSTLKKVAEQHRDDECRRLAFAWTRVPMSTLHSLPHARVADVTTFPNQLEGISVSFQRDVVGVITASTRLVVALSAVAATTSLSSGCGVNECPSEAADQQRQDSSSSSSSWRIIRFGSVVFRTLVPLDAIAWWARSTAYSFLAAGRGAVSLAQSIAPLGAQLAAKYQEGALRPFLRQCCFEAPMQSAASLLQSPRARVALYVAGVTGMTTAGAWAFRRIKDSRAVRRMMARKDDSVAVESGSNEYQAMRRHGRVLLTPGEIVANIVSMLRLQGHADQRLMQNWFDERESTSRSAEERKKQQHAHHHRHRGYFSSFLSNMRHSVVGDAAVVLAQNGLESFFQSTAQVSDWIVPLAAAAVYQRLLSQHGVVSRFLILECLNSASGLVSAVSAFSDTYETVSLHAYKALIVSRISSAAASATEEGREGDATRGQATAVVEGSSSGSSSASCFKMRSDNADDNVTRDITRHVLAKLDGIQPKDELHIIIHNSNKTLLLQSSTEATVHDDNDADADEQTQNQEKQKQVSTDVDFLFVYPSRPDRVVLRLNPVSFRLPLSCHSVVAITGASGCGKSTLLKLLLGEFDAKHHFESGEQAARARDSSLTLALQLVRAQEKAEDKTWSSAISNFAPLFLRTRLFSFVPQGSSLLPGSFNLAENVALAPVSARNPDAMLLQRVRHALHLASADDLVESMNEGIFTVIGVSSSSGGDGDEAESGGAGGGRGKGSAGASASGGGSGSTILLSGGQVQRVAIARALYHGTPVLLMDEPTSALDSANKMALLETLKRLVARPETLLDKNKKKAASPAAEPPMSPPRCVVYVTHDSDAIAAADHIVTLMRP